jgi:tRNA_anti-like
MAIIACKECAREVSDKAERCPHCGVSIAETVRRKPRRGKPWLYGALIVGLLVWATLTTLWLKGTLPVPKELVGFIETRGSPVPAVKAFKMVEPMPLGAVPSAPEVKPLNSAVYRTSAEQLYQDYGANEVAVQSKIDGSPIRLSGIVAEIDEDTSGHPVVTLHTGSDNGADMLLTDDQRSVAAQLTKEEAVEIQCNKMQRIAARLHGSGCALVLVDAEAKPVYLAVSLARKAGSAPLYIVGPMSRTTCLASSDTIAMQVTSNPRSERILSKSCAATARETVSLEGCHLSSTMSAIPDIPTAHVWKYDCMAPAADTRKAATIRTTTLAAAAATAAASPPSPAPAVAAPESDAPASAPASKLDHNLGSAGGAGHAINAGDASNASDASVPPQQPTPAAVPDPPSTAPPPPAAVDDLVAVRTKDPDAADRIVSYCSKITSGASDPPTISARCRKEEMDAWTRLIVQNEFPTLDEANRRKCNEPPFPDSFVARETCAKYQLRLD